MRLAFKLCLLIIAIFLLVHFQIKSFATKQITLHDKNLSFVNEIERVLNGRTEKFLGEQEISSLEFEGDSLKSLGKGDESTQIYEKIISLTYNKLLKSKDKKEIFNYKTKLAEIKAKSDRPDEALRIYQELLNEYPSNKGIIRQISEIHYQEGKKYVAEGKLDEAIYAYQTILGLNVSPEINAYSLDVIAYCYQVKKEYPRAIEVYQQIINTYPNLSTRCAASQFQIGNIYYRQKDLKTSFKEFQKVILNYPQTCWIVPAEEKIKTIEADLKQQAK